jgi:hypothetical protein
MGIVCRHADGDTSWDRPLPELEGLFGGYTRTAVHSAEAEAVEHNISWRGALFRHRENNRSTEDPL